MTFISFFVLIGRYIVFTIFSQERILTNTERRFMLNAERGDCASVATIIEQSKGEQKEKLNKKLDIITI